jgi:hypothetical protein
MTLQIFSSSEAQKTVLKPGLNKDDFLPCLNQFLHKVYFTFLAAIKGFKTIWNLIKRRHDTQHNGILHSNIQHNDIQHSNR